MSIYRAEAHCWSGLLSGDKYHWQQGLRNVCRQIGDVQFHSSMSGYEGFEKVAYDAINRKAKSLLLIGHSNGGYAITKIAQMVKTYDIECWLICFDRTMKRCPPLGRNVPYALDLWAGLKNLEPGPDFKGQLKTIDYSRESHIGVIANRQAQEDAIKFGRYWKEHK